MQLQLNNPIVSVHWLQEHLHTDNLVILNGTISKVTTDSVQNETRQIPHARFFDIKKVFSVQNAPFPNTMVDVETFTNEAQKLGIHQNSAIVVYDELGIYAAPRVWYMFKAMGFDNITVLDGGFPAWKAVNAPTAIKKSYNGVRGDFQGKDRLHLFKNYPEMLQVVEDDASIIVDARSAARFSGKVPEPRKGLRSGQIPNSKNLPYTKLLNGIAFKPKAALSTIFSTFQPVNSNAPFVFTCGSGITACVLALAAEYVGYSKYAVYDGSWTEWGKLHT